MIRIEQEDGWILITHRDHARLAAEFARQWGNDDFARPEPFEDIVFAVEHHDDAWAPRDAAPVVTRAGRPSAFSRELVGRYSAFEEIDLAEYLQVRGAATEVVAATNPFAAIIISMHTVNLLTEQADLRAIDAAQREHHTTFVAQQLRRQQELASEVAHDPRRAGEAAGESLQRAFEFLQGCDSLSLIACVDFPHPLPLRHLHPRRDGGRVTLEAIPRGAGVFAVKPWPFAAHRIESTVPFRRVRGKTFARSEALREAFHAAPDAEFVVRLEP